MKKMTTQGKNIFNLTSAVLCILSFVAALVANGLVTYDLINFTGSEGFGTFLFGAFAAYGWLPTAFIALFGIEYLVNYAKRYKRWKAKCFSEK